MMQARPTGYGAAGSRIRRCLVRSALAVALAGPAPAACANPADGDAGIRPPAVAGSFYPEDAGRLGRAIDGFLADALPRREARPIALVLPHAGYVYSGQIAADGWRQAAGRDFDLVVLLGTNHIRTQFTGLAVWDGGGFRTPLGIAPVDEAAAAALIAADPDCRAALEVHAGEHSVEVHVPFAQVVLPKAKILPVVVASDDPRACERYGHVLAQVLTGRRALIVASSDLSHYPAAEDAVQSDRAVLAAVAALDAAALGKAIAAQERARRANLVTCACGEGPVRVAIAAALALGAEHGTVLGYANSGDTAVGERERVVGYGAVMFTAGPPGADIEALRTPPAPPPGATLGPDEKRRLLDFARETIRRYLDCGMTPLARGFPPVTGRHQGAFVTLTERGELRGCIGHLAEDRPLAQVVGAMALAAAVQDPRFPPVAAAELPALAIEISVLSPVQRVPGPESIVVGRDGVVIRKEGRSAVFLPQVAVEQGWGRPTLLAHLCRKAGLDADAWKQGAEFSTFQATVFRESEFK